MSADEPLTLEQHLSDCFTTDRHENTGIFIDEDRFEEVMMRMVKIVSEAVARNDNAAKQRSDAADEARINIRAHVLRDPSITSGELTRLTGGGSTMVAEVRKKLVAEGKIRRLIGGKPGHGYELVGSKNEGR